MGVLRPRLGNAVRRLRAGRDRVGLAVALADAAQRDAAERLLARVPAERRVVLSGSPEEAHQRLLRTGAPGLLVVHRALDDAGHLQTWERLFPHVADDGRYLVAAAVLDRGQGERIRRRIEALRDRPLPKGWRARLGRPGLARSVAAARVGPEGLTLEKTGRHHLKLRESEVVDVVGARGTGLGVEVLATRPGGVLAAARTTSYPPQAGLGEPLPYPEAVVRSYAGDVRVGRGMVVVHDRLVLPETFKWHAAAELTNTRLVDIDDHVAELRDDALAGEVPFLPGSYYHFDYKNGGHYGHLVTEAISRLWGWDEARRRHPDLKILLARHPRDAGRTEARPDHAFLAAFGIDPGDVVWFDDAVRVERLVGATPLWHNQHPFHAHPQVREVWRRITAGLPADDGPTYDRIFVTRRSGSRLCRNHVEVEGIFADHGFEVVEPGGWSLGRQARVFARARVVAGFGGTGMFNLLHASGSPTVIVLNHDQYDARNEHLLAAVLGSEAHVFRSAAEIRHPEGGHSDRAFHSPWTFDLDRHARPLHALLGELGEPDDPDDPGDPDDRRA